VLRPGATLSTQAGGDPGLLNGWRNLQPYRDLRETGLDGRSPCSERTYGLHSIIPGHHQREIMHVEGNVTQRRDKRTGGDCHGILLE
jgi:hypothetical protein